MCDAKLLTVQNNTIAPNPPPEHKSPSKDVPAAMVRSIEDAILTTVSDAAILDFVTTFS
jgi:hypothetical protein